LPYGWAGGMKGDKRKMEENKEEAKAAPAKEGD